MKKLIVSLNPHAYDKLDSEARTRGISVQALLRAIVVPDWLNDQNYRKKTVDSAIVHGLKTMDSYGRGDIKKETISSTVEVKKRLTQYKALINFFKNETPSF